MVTRTDKMILFINDQIRLATQELEAIPQSSPSFKVMRRILVSLRDMIEIIQSVRPEPGEVLNRELDSNDPDPEYFVITCDNGLYWGGPSWGWTTLLIQSVGYKHMDHARDFIIERVNDHDTDFIGTKGIRIVYFKDEVERLKA